jgi:hypothetical protein
LRRLGKLPESVAVTQDRQKLWPKDAGQLYRVAGELGESAKAVGKGKTDLSTDEEKQRGQYLDLAMAALRQAMDAGFKDGERAAKDAALELLREREDFKALVTELMRK